MINKKAQSQIITTVLIILLVLAAIVIVWQVVNSTVAGGAQQVEDQSKCLGVNLEASQTSTTVFSVKRTATGGDFTTAEPIVLQNSARLVKGAGAGKYTETITEFSKPLGSTIVTLGTAAKDEDELEFGILGDGVTCPSTVTITVVA
jgi:regulatory protein YycI of two-component signal transduction system YycFG